MPAAMDEAAAVIRQYRATHKVDMVVTFVHGGPVFEWHPEPDREMLLRKLSAAGSDLVWGTGSHHVQRMENYKGRPIIYGLGNLIFPYIAGVANPKECEVGMAPCQQFRTDITVVYQFHIAFPGRKVTGIRAHPIHLRQRSDGLRAYHAPPEQRLWFLNVFNELSNQHGMAVKADPVDGAYWISLTNVSVPGVVPSHGAVKLKKKALAKVRASNERCRSMVWCTT